MKRLIQSSGGILTAALRAATPVLAASALAMGPALAGAAEESPDLKPPCIGLMIRHYRPGEPVPGFMRSAVLEVGWTELESSDQVFDGPGWGRIEAARRSGLRLRLRIFAGTQSPVFVKKLAGPPISDPEHGTDASATGGVAIWNLSSRRGGTIPRFWEAVVLDQYEQLMREVARRYDDAPEICEVVASGAMTLYAEPFYRGTRDSGTNARLLAAGLDFARDEAAQRRVIEIHDREFRHTRTSLAINAWDVIETTPPHWRSDFAPTAALVRWARAKMGPKLVLQNNGTGLDADPSAGTTGTNHFAFLQAIDGPKGFQTRTLPRLGGGASGLYQTLDKILSMGGSFAELPAGYQKVADVGRLESYQRRLEANVAPFPMPHLPRPEFPDRRFSIADFGAVAGGDTLNVDAIQRAIDACHEAGGGHVVVPAGRWLTTPLELKGGVDLHLEEGSVLVFTIEKQFYFGPGIAARLRPWTQNYPPDPQMKADPGLLPKPLIAAYDCADIAVTGKGTLDGQGIGWWPLHRLWWKRVEGAIPPEVRERAWRGLDPASSPARPRLVRPINCRNVWLEGFTAIDSPFWTVNPAGCENVVIRGLTIRAQCPPPWPSHAPNTDGIDPESCRNVLIEDCDIDTGDDAVAIKSGLDEAGRRRGLPCENVIVRRVRGRRFAIGSEMSGGVRNVYMHDCEVTGGLSHGIFIKTRRGRGGIVENVWVEDVAIAPTPGPAIRMDMEYWAAIDPAPPEPVGERTPRFRNIHFRRIRIEHPATSTAAVLLNGLPEMPPGHISFEDLDVTAGRGVVCRHITDSRLSHLALRLGKGPAVTIDDGRRISLSMLTVEQPAGPLLEVQGARSGGIVLDRAGAGHPGDIVFSGGAAASALTFSPEAAAVSGASTPSKTE